ncbi:hypothetical protein P3T29_005569 [Kitasatospora sp. MAP5-34]|nr:hypothetical protein [Kitasatospora sp. MAP5-34]
MATVRPPGGAGEHRYYQRDNWVIHEYIGRIYTGWIYYAGSEEEGR